MQLTTLVYAKSRHPTLHVYLAISIASIFIIDRKRKQFSCPLMDKSIMKTWYIYKKEYHSAVKKNKIHI